jgi:hypothetical protein
MTRQQWLQRRQKMEALKQSKPKPPKKRHQQPKLRHVR